MDRDDFFNNRRARHFERSNQNNFQSPRENNRKVLRDIYQEKNYNNTSEFLSPFGVFNPYMVVPFPLPHNRYQHTLTPPSSERDLDLSFQMSRVGLDESRVKRTPTPSKSLRSSQSSRSQNRFSLLPMSALDENGKIRSDWTLQKVVDRGLLLTFAMDKSGCHFLQSHFYGPESTPLDEYLRSRIYEEVLFSSDRFHSVATNMFGNFFLQRIIENSRAAEQDVIRKYLTANITEYCLDKSACRVVQTALERMRAKYVDQLVDSIPRDSRLMDICTDQNANHVIQKVVKKMALKKWEFIVDFLCISDPDNLINICQGKYGCRVVQTIIETLTVTDQTDTDRLRVLRRIMSRIVAKCQRLTSNEFANYVIQHVIETPGVLSEYRNAIIKKCLLRNLLSMSQEKYASHVVERAFTFAPLPYLAEMMDEIFDGYLPHPETGKDALDILLFHQFGNYVVQRMLQVCCYAVLGKRSTIINGTDCRYKFEGWLNKLSMRARKEKARLSRFSSGKKILDILDTMTSPFELERRPNMFSSSSSGDIFSPPPSSALFSPSTTNSVSSENPEYDYFSKF